MKAPPTPPNSDELIEIKELLNKGENLDARDELRLKSIISDLGPQNGKVLFENISNADGELGDYTGDVYNTVATNAFSFFIASTNS